MDDSDKIYRIGFYIREIKELISDCDMSMFYKDKKTLYSCVFCLSEICDLVNQVKDLKQYDIINELLDLKRKIFLDYKVININYLWDFVSTQLNTLENLINDISVKIRNQFLKNFEELLCRELDELDKKNNITFDDMQDNGNNEDN